VTAVRILVAVASKHGATQEIADALGRELDDRGHDAEVRAATDVRAVDHYDAIILGSAVYAGHWLEPAKKLVDDHAAALAARPVWLFSSGPIGEPEPKPEGDPVDVAELTAKTAPRGHRVFPGKIDKSKLGFAEKAIVRALLLQVGDFRDWDAVAGWAHEIARELAPDPQRG
jgi:menaquinone-dependent protoporphyrinogen oxidase